MLLGRWNQLERSVPTSNGLADKNTAQLPGLARKGEDRNEDLEGVLMTLWQPTVPPALATIDRASHRPLLPLMQGEPFPRLLSMSSVLDSGDLFLPLVSVAIFQVHVRQFTNLTVVSRRWLGILFMIPQSGARWAPAAVSCMELQRLDRGRMQLCLGLVGEWRKGQTWTQLGFAVVDARRVIDERGALWGKDST